MRRDPAFVLVVLAGVVAVAASASPGQKAKPPRIVSAVMQDADRDAKADGVRLTYSAPVRHAADRDGRYPFSVAGYRIRSVGAASGKALVILLLEKARPDPLARPTIRYRPTRSKPVLSTRAGMQAAAQLFRATRAHRHTPPVVVAPTTTTPTATSTTSAAADFDGDGYPDAQDCAPKDVAIHPGAPDLPDLAFVDSNCDGIDGTEKDAVFVSPKGDDANPGTKEKPKREINAAVKAAASMGKKYVLAAGGSPTAVSGGAEYTGVTVLTGIGIYGGYDPNTWARKTELVTLILGVREGVLADGAKDVSLQLLTIHGFSGDGQAADGASAYGIRAINGSGLRLQRVTVIAHAGAIGQAGGNGAPGRDGSPGYDGHLGACDSKVSALGGPGGASPVGREGGKGGDGRYESSGQDGATGIVGTPGGKGGRTSVVEGVGIGYSGDSGAAGTGGAPGAGGAGGTNEATLAAAVWQGRGGIEGIYGAPGNGGGGGGAGGGQKGSFVINGTGNGGGGGGGGGEGGRGGAGGGAGGGSFGVYLSSSSLVADKSSIAAGNGGPGGHGGDGGPGGVGGKGGRGPTYCGKEIGAGGDGGRGGNGGQGGGGGGGAGGPSIGVFKVGSATENVTLVDTKVTFGTPGPGGAPGSGGTPGAKAQAGIAQAVYP